ncbi:MAG TPA: sugar ABC transporter permease, partial [Bradyrhizobium sp.]
LPQIFVWPSMAALVVLSTAPLVVMLNIALQNRNLDRPTYHYVWLRNFWLLMFDQRFLDSIRVSLIWELVTVIGTMAVALGMAILLRELASERVKSLASAIFIIPVLLPRVSAAYCWKFMFHPLFGVIMYPIRLATGVAYDPLASPEIALYTVAFVDVWQWGLFFAVIIMRLFEMLPKQPLEAAQLDHTRTPQLYFYVAIPMMAGPLISLTFVKMVESLRSFDLIYVMTRGGPGTATETLDMYAYSQGFIESGRISYASCMAILMMIATAVAFTTIWKWVQRWHGV